MEPASSFFLKKCRRSESSLENQIDSLPDDVLISIISYLNLKEVARTSVLSWRWRYLWRHTTGILDFVESVPKCHSNPNILDSSGSSLIDWVNLVLNLLSGSTLEEFKVCFGMSNESKDVINGWIKFALERRVKRLLLDFRQLESSVPFALRAHDFTNYPLGSLTCLHLKNVEMTGKFLGLILWSFPLLQVLDLNSISGLARLKIAGPLPSLRYLKIKHCSSLRHIKVHAVNLVSFSYRGPKLKNFEIPRIVEASTNQVSMINRNTPKFSSYFSRLESLKLDLQDWRPKSKSLIIFDVLDLLEFENLKFLKLSGLRTTFDTYIDVCTKLFQASSPSLQRFVLKIYSILGNEDKDIILPPAKKRVHYLYKQLKVMEVHGFRGYTKDVDLTLRLCSWLSGLETLVVDPYPISPLDQCGNWDVEKAVTRARRMQNSLPIGTKLVIASHQNTNYGSD